MAIPTWKLRFIHQAETTKLYNNNGDLTSLKSKDKVVVVCSSCNLPNIIVSIESIRIKKPHTVYIPICKSCQQKRTWTQNNYKTSQSDKISKSIKTKWQEQGYRQQISNTQSAKSKKLWSSQDYRDKISKAISKAHSSIEGYTQAAIRNINNNPELAKLNHSKSMAQKDYRELLSNKSRENWLNLEYRKKVLDALNSDSVRLKISNRLKTKWADPQYANQIASNTVSNLEIKLASILDDIGIKYTQQYHIGHWPFDFLIPHKPKDILIEVHGDYWHGTKHDYNRSKDKAKATFIQSYHADRYDLKIIWEHEFLSHNRIISLLKKWLGLEAVGIVEFDIKRTIIKACDTTESQLFFSKYHYYANGGRNGINIGCYHGDTLIACARFCSPTRSQSADRLKVLPKNLKELTRFAIRPDYQKKNLASYLLSKAVKLIDADILLTFADATYGHEGTIYKAAGWIFDGAIEPDYFYVDHFGYVMHKRTLWGHASKMSMTECEFAAKYGYTKKFGKEKYRYIYKKRGAESRPS